MNLFLFVAFLVFFRPDCRMAAPAKENPSFFCNSSEGFPLSLCAVSKNTATGLINQEQEIHSPLKKTSLLLIYVPSCPYCRRVLDYLVSIQKAIPLCNVRVNRECVDKLMREGKKGLVPCLFINDVPLYDANRIVEWLQFHQDLLEPLSKGSL